MVTMAVRALFCWCMVTMAVRALFCWCMVTMAVCTSYCWCMVTMAVRALFCWCMVTMAVCTSYCWCMVTMAVRALFCWCMVTMAVCTSYCWCMVTMAVRALFCWCMVTMAVCTSYCWCMVTMAVRVLYLDKSIGLVTRSKTPPSGDAQLTSAYMKSNLADCQPITTIVFLVLSVSLNGQSLIILYPPFYLWHKLARLKKSQDKCILSSVWFAMVYFTKYGSCKMISPDRIPLW